MGALNPWFESSPPLSSSGILKEGEHPLVLIREFILNWPGEETVKLDDLTRHNRLVQIIAGYPEIDVGRYPLDWPLSNKAAKALRLTLYLDSISSPDKDNPTSLRSALLNKAHDMKLRMRDSERKISELTADNEEEKKAAKKKSRKEFQAAHRRFLAILLLSVRHLEEDPENSFSDQENKLLLAIHSNSQGRIADFWPRNEIKDVINNKWSEWDSEKSIPTIRQKNRPKGYCIGWENNLDLMKIPIGNRVSVKMRSIQSWITNWSDKYRKWNDDAAFIRGASAILESVMSRFRYNIIQNYGVESIIVDGGGRIEFIGDDNAKKMLEQAFHRVFLISNKHQPYFNNEIEMVARTLSEKFSTKLSAADYGLIYGMDSDKWEDKSERERLIQDWIERHLPVLSIVESDSIPLDVKFSSIVNSDCCICSEDVELVGDPYNRDNQINDPSNPYCNFHRLLYNIGNAQRMIDSTTKEFGFPQSFTNNYQRTVNGVARLDLNSLGVLFTSSRVEGLDNSVDIKRRRSMRFNSQWWSIVNDALDNKDLNVDQIVAWVAAGDDIILADYVPVGNNPTPKLRPVIKKLSQKLGELSKSEYAPFELSFGAGLSTKDVDDNIINMMSKSKSAEKSAKRYWKQRTDEDSTKDWMIEEYDGSKKQYEKVADDGGFVDLNGGSVLYQHPV